MDTTMKQRLIFGLLLSLLIGGGACGAAAAAPEIARQPQTVSAQSRAASSRDSGGKNAPGAAKKSTESVAGIYEYDTYKGKKEGYRNTLQIEQTGSELKVSISGAYIYRADGAATVKEAEGGGKGKLSRRTAILELRDERNAVCRATINFAPGRATLKVSDACRFNVVLSGVYKKTGAKSGAK